VWVGNSDNREMRKKSDGSFVSAPIWRAFLDTVLEGKPAEAFTPPAPIPSDLKPVLRGEDPGVTRIRIDRTTGKRATPLTPPELVEEREYRTLHTILHSVRRDDPRGAPPERPEDDPMYRPWEDALAAWAARNNIVASAPPAEEDDVHTEANRPALAVTMPSAGTAITGRDILIEGTASAPRGISRIEAHVNGVAAALFAPSNGTFRQSVRLPAITDRGVSELRMTAYDDVGNRSSITIPIVVQSDREPITLAWEQPTEGAVLRAGDFPVTLVVRATAASGANRLEISLTDASSTEPLTSVVPQTTGETRVLWPHVPPPGPVSLRASMFRDDTLLAESGERKITIAP